VAGRADAFVIDWRNFCFRKKEADGMKRFLLLVLLFPVALLAQQKQAADFIISGNEYYQQKQFAKAEELYAKAINAEPENTTAKYNLAAALYRQDKKVEAGKLYTDVVNTTSDKELRGKAWYNKGVILSKLKNTEESIEAYKKALRNNPTDTQARENLQKALLELKKKNPPKQKKDDPKKKQEQQKKQPQSQLKPKEVEQQLKLLQQKEKEVQQKVQKANVSGAGSQAKDW
jgi:tetratricopeptide (TPR) repeat protein